MRLFSYETTDPKIKYLSFNSIAARILTLYKKMIEQ